MTNFQKYTKSPEVLAELLTEICLPDGPWDMEFHKRYCKNCVLDDCPEVCPHGRYRNNPLWWLRLKAQPDCTYGKTARDELVEGMIDEITAKIAERIAEAENG